MRLGYEIAKKERIEQDRYLAQQLLKAQGIAEAGSSHGPGWEGRDSVDRSGVGMEREWERDEVASQQRDRRPALASAAKARSPSYSHAQAQVQVQIAGPRSGSGSAGHAEQRPASAGRIHRVRLGGHSGSAANTPMSIQQTPLARHFADQQQTGSKHDKTSPYKRARNQGRTVHAGDPRRSDDSLVMFAPSPDLGDLKPVRCHVLPSSTVILLPLPSNTPLCLHPNSSPPAFPADHSPVRWTEQGRSDSPTLTSRRTLTGESFTPRTTHTPSASASALRVGLQLIRGGASAGAALPASDVAGSRRHAVNVGGQQRVRAPKKIFGHPL